MASPTAKTDRTEQRLGTEPILRLMMKLAIPSVIAQLINMLYNIVDRIYVGHIPGDGALALTGLGISSPLLMLVAAFASFVGGGGAPLAAIALGRKEKEKASHILSSGLTLLIILGVLLTTTGLIFQEQLLRLFGASAETLPYADAYTRIYLMGTVFVMISLGLTPFISAQGEATRAMVSVIIGAVSNIILDPIFIYTFKMGVRGAALATIISQFFSALYTIRFLTSSRSTIRIKKGLLRPRLKMTRRVFALGLSPFIMMSTESAISMAFNNALMIYGGVLYVGAMTIMQSAMQLCTLPMMGFVQGVQPIISFNFGAGHVDRIKATIKNALLIAGGFSLLYFTFVLTAPQLFAGIFTGDPTLIKEVGHLLPIYMLGSGIFFIQNVTQGYLVSTGQAGKSLFIAMLRKIILLIPLIFILPNFLGVKGIIIAEPAADITSVIVSAIFLTHEWRTLVKRIHQKS